MKVSLGPRTLVYPHPVFLVGSYDAEGRANIMTASWAGICCSKPPCVAVSLREATYSFGCLRARGAFTINIPSVDQVCQADFAGVHSGRNQDKLAATGLTAARAASVDAPFIEQCPVHLECRLLKEVELGLHTQFVGEILDVQADRELLGENGLPLIERVRPFVYSSSDGAYFGLGPRLAPAFAVGQRG